MATDSRRGSGCLHRNVESDLVQVLCRGWSVSVLHYRISGEETEERRGLGTKERKNWEVQGTSRIGDQKKKVSRT
jgi:hypothetical protein